MRFHISDAKTEKGIREALRWTYIRTEPEISPEKTLSGPRTALQRHTR
jgi:hypothetical protein